MSQFPQKSAPRTPRQRRAFACLILVLCLTALHGEAKPQSDLEARLQQLVASEQAALDANDTVAILRAGKELGGLSLQLLAQIAKQEGRCSEASDAYEYAVELAEPQTDAQAGTTPDLQLELGLLAADLCAQRAEPASRIAEQILRKAGDTAQAHLLLANAHHSEGDLPGTIAEVAHAVKLTPNSAPAHLALGNAFWELNEYGYNRETLHEFEDAQRLSPAEYLPNLDLGAVLSEYERYAEAAPYLEQAATADSTAPDPWLQMGMNLYLQGRLTEAKPMLEKAVALTGVNEAMNQFQIRRAYSALSRIEAADGHPGPADTWSGREQVLAAKAAGSATSMLLSESTGVSIRASQPAPKSPVVAGSGDASGPPTQHDLEQKLKLIAAKSLNDAGTVLARQRDYAAALPLFRIAAAEDPDLGPVMRNLGLAAFHVEDYPLAIRALSRALEQNPDDTLVRTNLDASRAHFSDNK